MARCGEKYQSMIRSASGKKPDARCTLYCNEADVEDWQEGARQLRKRIMARAAQVELSAQLADDLGIWSNEIDSMEEPAWYPGEWGTLIGGAIALMGEGVCLFDRIEQEAAAQGQSVSPLPTPADNGGGNGLPGLDLDLKGVGTLAAIIGGAYLLTRD